MRLQKVCREGSNTNTPELKQSGQPTSGAADNSSRSKSSSTFCSTSVSASKNTHFEYCMRRHALIFEKVTPSSGRDNRAKCSMSPESSSLMSTSSSHTRNSCCLGVQRSTYQGGKEFINVGKKYGHQEISPPTLLATKSSFLDTSITNNSLSSACLSIG